MLVHCTAGKDRTGVVCALILALAGVEDRLVAEEYALTAVGLEPFKDAIRQRLEKTPVFVKGDESARVGMENLLSSTYVLISLGGRVFFFVSLTDGTNKQR